MEYKELARLYHMNAAPSRDADLLREEMRRRTADSTFSTGVETRYGELFVAMPRELSLLNERILSTEQRVATLVGGLPTLTSGSVLRGLVLDEVVSTNAIEDIDSTRKQVRDALETAPRKNGPSGRFRELGLLYLDILDGTARLPRTLEDIRAIYDRVVDGELDDAHRPDGALFRAGGVDVVRGGAKVIHSGLEPESKIEEALGRMLDLLGNDRVPSLLSAAAAHFVFEWAHPFYDGNGRTGRYLLSLAMSETLSAPTVLSLSRAIQQNRSSYYRAFRAAEDPLNKGELTFFVMVVLTLVGEAQAGVIGRLEEARRLQRRLDERLSEVEAALSLSRRETQLVATLAQHEAFSLVDDVSLAEVAAELGIGEQMARKHLKALSGKGVVERTRGRDPVRFALTQDFRDVYLGDLSW